MRKLLIVFLLLLIVFLLLLILCAAGEAGFLVLRMSGETAAAPRTESARLTPAPTPTPSPTPSPTPEPTPTPTPTPDPAQVLLGRMSLHEKLCQLLLLSPEELDPGSVTAAGPGMAEALSSMPVGGLFLQTANMVSQDQLRQMTADLQSMSRIPLLVTCDEEGGTVSRLMRTVGTTWIDSMLNYQYDGTETAYRNAETIAGDMAALGFNLDLAPVADVWSNPSNTVIARRAYSDDFGQAAVLLPAAVEGFHAGGVACTLKHFPGHGDTSEDSHTGAAFVYKSLDELRQEELLPFRAGIEAGADAVMIGHLIVTAVSDEPALFSHIIVTELLREELGFSGVVMTDALDMDAVSVGYTQGEIAVRALEAGVDLLLCPTDPDGVLSAMMEAVQSGRLTEDRIDESVLRILRLKEDRGFL